MVGIFWLLEMESLASIISQLMYLITLVTARILLKNSLGEELQKVWEKSIRFRGLMAFLKM